MENVTIKIVLKINFTEWLFSLFLNWRVQLRILNFEPEK